MSEERSESRVPRAKPPQTIWRRLLKWSIRVAVVVVVMGIAAWSIAKYWAAKTIREEISKVRAAGEPLTFGELRGRRPKVVRTEDGGPYYVAAAELANQDYAEFFGDKTNDDFFSREKKPATEMLEKIQKIVERNQKALELMDLGSAMPHCGSDVELNLGMDVATLRMGKIRNLSNYAALRTRTLAYRGQTSAAVDSAISSLGVVRMFDGMPVLLVSLVQSAVAARVASDIRVVLEEGALDEASLNKLGGALRQMRLVTPREMLLAERVYSLEIVRDTISSDWVPNPNAPLLPERQLAGSGVMSQIMAAQRLRSHARFVAATTGDWPEIVAQTQKVSAEARSMIDDLIVTSYASVVVTMGRTESIIRALRVAVEVERHRLAHGGELPEKLEELGNFAELPTDPFTGKALKYVKVADGYCVFSEGLGPGVEKGMDAASDPVKWAGKYGMHVRTAREDVIPP